MLILVNMAILIILMELSFVDSGEYGDSDKSFGFGELSNFVNLVILMNMVILVHSGFC